MWQQAFLHGLILDVKGETTVTSNGSIDLYTQKEPFGGKGPDMPSDAFSPGEVVVLYALVTADGVPKQNLPVGFCVQIPDNTSFSMVAKTNVSGIARINFRIPEKCGVESEIFGEWVVLANVLIGNMVFYDRLTFKVDWIIKLVSLRTVGTIDENLTYRRYFGIGGDVGLEINLISIAMSIKRATFSIVVQDETNVPISYLEIPNLEVQPNEKLICLYGVLNIPKWVRPGNATAFVSALTAPINQSGVPYCPARSTNFFITIYEPLTITFHDVAIVKAAPSAESVEVGQLVNIGTVVQNEGTDVESFNVSAFYDGVLIGTLQVTALKPYSHVNLNFTFNTSIVDVGNYTITVSIPYLVNEADITDNVFIDGIIEIKPKLPTIIHNIAITDVQTSSNSVYIGELLQINVSVTNKGTETEAFNVSTYYDFSLIETLQVSSLAANTQVTLIFVWNTSFVREGFYLISASAPLPSDIDVSDNTFADGVVQVMARPPLPPIHDVAVLSVSPSKMVVYIGEVVEVYVIVKNQGNYAETFNLTAYADLNTTVIGDEITVGTWIVRNLEPNAEKPLVFHWNTWNVAEGNFTLSAEASAVPGELNIEDNRFVDGVVWVKSWVFPPVWEVPRWLLALLFLLAVFIGACLIAAIIFALLWRRERKKKGQMDRQPTYPEVKPREKVGFKKSKTCGVCGKEFPGAYTFCPYCFTFHGKDYE
jgi:hypothetical protein